MEFSVKLSKICLGTSFSRIFAKNGNRHIGRNKEAISGGLLALETRIIIEKYECLGIELSKCVRRMIGFLFNHLVTSAVMMYDDNESRKLIKSVFLFMYNVNIFVRSKVFD